MNFSRKYPPQKPFENIFPLVPIEIISIPTSNICPTNKFNCKNNSSSRQKHRINHTGFARFLFQVFDKHNRGYITASDLRAVLQCLGEDLSEEESKFLARHLHSKNTGKSGVGGRKRGRKSSRKLSKVGRAKMPRSRESPEGARDYNLGGKQKLSNVD